MLLHEVTKLAKLLLVLPATSTISERSFSAMKRIKAYLRSTASGNRLHVITCYYNHCMLLHVITTSMLLHVHCKKTDHLNMIKIAKEFVGDNQARPQTFGKL